MIRYAVQHSSTDGTTVQIEETADLTRAKFRTERLAKVRGGYYFVVDRSNESVVYVYAGPERTRDTLQALKC